ncbi:MAG: hypothetical protein IJC71_00140 [Clostridia bacterium]|nr:hypothetical protein [Clostridia bacterium]
MKTFSRILLAVLALILAAILTVTTLFTGLLACVRAQFTPGFVYNVMNSIDYASLEVPDPEGNAAPLCDIVNAQLRDFGISFSEQDFNSAIRSFSIDSILSAYIQDLRTWLLDDGPAPVLNPRGTAQTILSGLDSSLLMFLSFFGDPEALLTDALSNLTRTSDAADFFASAQGVRALLSEGTLFFVISISGSLFLLILCTHRLRIVPTAVLTGGACVIAGSVMLFFEKILAPCKAQALFEAGMPESTVDLFYRPLMDTVHRTGTVIALGGLAALIIFAVFGAFASMIRREKAAAEAAADRTSFTYDMMQAYPLPPEQNEAVSSPASEAPEQTAPDAEKTDEHNIHTEY